MKGWLPRGVECGRGRMTVLCHLGYAGMSLYRPTVLVVVNPTLNTAED